MSSGQIILNNVVQEYPNPAGGLTRVVDGITLFINEPKINMLLGPSGCGKSTLLRMMGGVRPPGVKTPTSGEVLIDGIPCYGPHNDAVMVFQRYLNRPDLTVRQNVAFPFRTNLWKKKVPRGEQVHRVNRMLEAVGLSDKAELKPSQLSGGQNQRVALAMALVLHPKILLMDEPFGALDPQTRGEMQSLLLELWELHRCQIVFVTHDVDEALLLGDRILVLSSQPASISLDLTITADKPRNEKWLRSDGIREIRDQIISQL